MRRLIVTVHCDSLYFAVASRVFPVPIEFYLSVLDLHIKKRGYALFFAGAKRMLIRFDIAEYKLRHMGRGGGGDAAKYALPP
jgi:hypothetical protein